MALKQTTPSKEIAMHTIKQLRRLEASIINTLMYAGEQCVNEARNSGAYKDQTGNLRSSIGYVVLHNGRVVSPIKLSQVKQGGKGVKDGEKFINELIGQYSKGYVLLVVAGMEYAAYVEAKSLNVLASSELKAAELVPRLLKNLGIK